jgi:hypothetical protein
MCCEQIVTSNIILLSTVESISAMLDVTCEVFVYT